MAKLLVNDKVKVIAGKAKGHEAIITKISGDRVFLDSGIIIKKHVKPTQQNPNGGIVEKQGSTHISNVALLDPKTKGQTTKVGYEIDKHGKKTRIARKSGASIK